MKPGWFIMVTGLVGSGCGVVAFILTRWLMASLILRLVTGGLVAVIVPLIVVAIFYPLLISGKSEDQLIKL